MSDAVRRNYSCFVDCDQPTEVLIDYLQDLICATKDPKEVGVLVEVMLRLQHSEGPPRDKERSLT
jgi:hypothetical protein